MRKIYLKPVVDIDTVDYINIICASKEISPSAEFGAKGQYAPDEWINENHNAITDWPSVGIEEDQKDLFSRSNTSVFD